MNFIEAVQSGFRRYGSATGRAIRSEYWYWTLFTLLVAAITFAADYVLFPNSAWSPIQNVAGLLLLLPSWAVAIRRLHDIDRTGYWILIALTGIGIILLCYWACLRGTEGGNDYGPDPLRAPVP